MDTKFSFLDTLNPEQRVAATIADGYELMLAGAGTGKTHTLITRVAYLIENGVNPSRILLLTFTRKAAEEMQKRLVEYVGFVGSQVTANTFHSFIIEILRSHCKMLGLSEDFRVLDKSDEKTLLRHIRNGYLESNQYSKSQIKEFPSPNLIGNVLSLSINKQISREMTIEWIGDECLEKYKKEVLEILRLFQEKKELEHYYGFDDLLQVFLDCLENNPVFCDRMNDLYTHVMCDEYQDTNVIQEKILNLLTRKHQNLCVVGDDNQSIYRFRAAEIQNILDFDKRRENVSVVTLTRNYRSTQEILDVSNCMMEYALEGIPKQLRGCCHGEKPKYHVCMDDKVAARYLYDLIKTRYRSGILLKEQCVLVRNSNVSVQLEKLCVQYGLPYRKMGGQKFLEAHDVKCVLNFLRLSVNDKDELALRGMLQEYPGLGQKSMEQVITFARLSGVDVLLAPENYLSKYVKIKTSLAPFGLFWSELHRAVAVSDKIGVIGVHYQALLEMQLQHTSSADKIDKITRLQDKLSGTIKVLQDMAEDSRSVTAFLDELSLEGVKEKSQTEDMLTISTIHSAKGLEWDCVALLQPVEELFHDWDATEEDLAEELRVLYVALTRAKKHLDLVQSQYMVLNGKNYVTSMTSFLNHKDVLDTMDFV